MNRDFDYVNLNALVSNQIYPEALTDVSLHDLFLLGSSSDLSIGTIESSGLGVFRHIGRPAQEENLTDCSDRTSEIPLLFCTVESSLASVTVDEEDDLPETSLCSYSTSTSTSNTQCLMNHSHDDGDEPRTFHEHAGTLDVLLGRGPQFYQHSGNVHFHTEKLLIQEQYLQASKLEKKALSQRLVDKVHSRGGNFLKKDTASGKWIIVSSETARQKAAQALRETFTPERRREKRRKYQS